MSSRLKRRFILMIYTAIVFLVATLGLRLAGEGWTSTASQASGPVAPVEPGSEQTIVQLQTHLQSHPDDAAAYALLGLAMLQRVRETADPLLYSQAEQAFGEALARDPQQLDALMGQGILAAARHDFRGALVWTEQAQAINPHRAQIYGIMADAQIELGRYDEAAITLQQMVDLRPDLSSYSRISYLRELHGDRAGAIVAMQQAVTAGGPAAENTLWTQVQLGHLYFNQGDLEAAEKCYLQALRVRPDYIYAAAGIAQVRAAQKRYAEAVDYYEDVVEQLPLPAFVIALGELYEAMGRTSEAKNQYELVQVIARLNVEAGMNVDLELAMFNADHSADPAQTLRQARSAYQQRPSIYGADALAWALYQNGNYAEADRYSREARHLQTRDALLYYHAGMIAQAQGHLAEAEHLLEEALAINPYFNILQADVAQASLKQLRQSQ